MHHPTLLRPLLLGLFLGLLSGCTPEQEAAVQASAAEQPVDVIAFGSCARQDRPQPVWEPILAQRPDLFLFIGDNIYADTEDMDEMRRKYAELGAQPGYQRLAATTPVLATWDDHDYGRNDAGHEYPMKEASQREFLTFFNEPASSPRWQRPGVYDARVYGPEGRRVQVILLDTRYFRSPLQRWPEGQRRTRGPYRPSDDPEATVLGEDQWRWLEEQLHVPAEVRLIASSIQVIPEEHGWEMWANFPRERERLFRLLRDTRAGGVVLLSGDRHLAEISRLAPDHPAGVGYGLYEITSSGLTQEGDGPVEEANRHRVTPKNYRGTNFGLVTIDWSRPDPLLRLQVHDAEGQVLFQEEAALGTLQP